jgi:hypothetical protein
VALAGKTGASVASKWATNLTAAAANSGPGGVAAGVQAYVQNGGNPMYQASLAADKWATGVANAKSKWVARLTQPSMTGQYWQTSMTTKGIGRISGGATAAAAPNGKMTEFMTELLAFETQALASLTQTNPRTADVNSNITRATVWMQKMATFRAANPLF